MLFSITGWVEPEPGHLLSTPNYNWTQTGLLHISAGMTLDFSYLGKNTIVNFF